MAENEGKSFLPVKVEFDSSTPISRLSLKFFDSSKLYPIHGS